MYELWQLLAAYFVGTAAGIIVFRQAIREQLVSGAIDALVENDYVRSTVDEEGTQHLKKWYDLEDLLEDANVRIRMDDESEREDME